MLGPRHACFRAVKALVQAWDAVVIQAFTLPGNRCCTSPLSPFPPVQPASAQATATLQALSSYGAPEPPLQAACFQQWQALVACVPQGGDVEHALKLVGLRVPWLRQSRGGYWLCLGWGRVRGRAWAGAE